jgi:DNA-binding transcriptional ArsR family regulator
VSQRPVLPALDPVIHSQPRLRVTVALAALSDEDRITFPRLQGLVGMTAGNLATHLRKLEEAGYIEINKSYRSRTPVTLVRLTPVGRRALEDYTTALRLMLNSIGPPISNGAKPNGAVTPSGPAAAEDPNEPTGINEPTDIEDAS